MNELKTTYLNIIKTINTPLKNSLLINTHKIKTITNF